jgi:hypothetical protein
MGATGAAASGLAAATCKTSRFTGRLSDLLALAKITNTPDRFSTVSTPHRFGEFSPANRMRSMLKRL